MLYTLLVAGQVFTQTPDVDVCQQMRVMMITDMVNQVVNRAAFTPEQLVGDLSKMVICKAGVEFFS